MSENSTISIAPARLPDDIETVRGLFREYIDSLGIDLSFQDVEAELADLPGKYAQPAGIILLARDNNGEALGCIALRPMGESGAAEMKRLYVRPEARGHNLGRRLVVEIMDYARSIGYKRVVLDTLATLYSARKLYASLDFDEIEAYYDNPRTDVIYLGRAL
ncbi:GNAT family N-acetyltransferase [bacterium]|nr:MAG: GNAT family N-acetyltransferase [bacterium]